MPTDVHPVSDANLPTPIKSHRIGLTVGLFLVLISMAISGPFILIGGGLVYRNLEAQFWKTAPGTLFDARLVKPAPGANAPETPEVHYMYVVDGRRYQSTHWSPAGNGMNLVAHLEAIRKETPLRVYYNPRHPADAALYLPSPNMGYLPFTLGLGLFCFFTIALGGGVLYSALHPDLASKNDAPVRQWMRTGIRIGVALILTSLTGIATLIAGSEGGWWQWALSVVAVIVALKWRRPPGR